MTLTEKLFCTYFKWGFSLGTTYILFYMCPLFWHKQLKSSCFDTLFFKKSHTLKISYMKHIPLQTYYLVLYRGHANLGFYDAFIVLKVNDITLCYIKNESILSTFVFIWCRFFSKRSSSLEIQGWHALYISPNNTFVMLYISYTM